MRFCAAVVLLLVALATPAAAQSCRNYPSAAAASIKAHVEALRRIEQETADRIKGLDTRTYEWLVEQARSTAAVIADARALEIEESLSRCRNYIPPVRRTCAAAARGLVSVIEEQMASSATKKSKKSFAESASQCERLVRLAPLSTMLRTVDLE